MNQFGDKDYSHRETNATPITTDRSIVNNVKKNPRDDRPHSAKYSIR